MSNPVGFHGVQTEESLCMTFNKNFRWATLAHRQNVPSRMSVS